MGREYPLPRSGMSSLGQRRVRSGTGMSMAQSLRSPGEVTDMSPPDGRFSPILTAILYAQMIIFPVSYIYQSGLARILILLKWAPVLGMFLLFVNLAAQNRAYLNKTSTLLFSGLLISALLSSVASPYATASFSELGGLSILLFNALMLATLIQRRRAMNHLFNIIMNVGRVIIAVSFAMVILGINLGRGQPRFSGWSDNPNSLAMIIAPAIIVLFARYTERRPRRNIRYLPFLLAGLAVLVMTGSRGSIGWVLISFLMFPISRMNSGIRLILVLGTLTLLLALGDTLFVEAIKLVSRDNYSGIAPQFDAVSSGRTEAWDIGLKSIGEHPLLGLGNGNETRLLRENASLFVNYQGEYMHSSYMSILVENGVLGTAILGLTLVMAVARGFRLTRVSRCGQAGSRPTAILSLAILVGALAHASVETWLMRPGNTNALLFWVLVARSISSPSALRAQTHAGTVLGQ